jgi:mono/diheme cytochrome c family protein
VIPISPKTSITLKKLQMDKQLIQKWATQAFHGKRLLSVTAMIVALGVAGIAHAFGVPSGDSAAPAASANPYAGSTEEARKGEELFGRNCQQCHNTRGHGGKCPQLVRGAWAPGGANSDHFMFDTITKGRPNTQMGAWGEALSQSEIWQIVTFLREEAARVKVIDSRKKTDDDDSWY